MFSCWAPNTSSPWNSVTAKLGARSPPSPEVLMFVIDEELTELEEPEESTLLPQATKIIVKTDSANIAILGLLNHLTVIGFEGDRQSVPDVILRPRSLLTSCRRTVL